MLQRSSKPIPDNKLIRGKQLVIKKTSSSCPSVPNPDKTDPIEQHYHILPRLFEEDEKIIIGWHW